MKARLNIPDTPESQWPLSVDVYVSNLWKIVRETPERLCNGIVQVLFAIETFLFAVCECVGTGIVAVVSPPIHFVACYTGILAYSVQKVNLYFVIFYKRNY